MKLYAAYIIIFTVFIFPLAACKEQRDYMTADKVFTVSVPKKFKKTSSRARAVFQCVSKDKSAETAFFSYRTEDLAETADSATLLEIFIDEAAAEMKSFERAEEEEIYVTGGKYIRRIICVAAEKDNTKHTLVFSSVDFYGNPEVVLIALQSVTSGKYGQYERILRKIIESAKVN